MRRPGITDALNLFEGEHAIRNRRGHIALRDRAALERFAQGLYGGAEAEYVRALLAANKLRVLRTVGR